MTCRIVYTTKDGNYICLDTKRGLTIETPTKEETFNRFTFVPDEFSSGTIKTLDEAFAYFEENIPNHQFKMMLKRGSSHSVVFPGYIKGNAPEMTIGKPEAVMVEYIIAPTGSDLVRYHRIENGTISTGVVYAPVLGLFSLTSVKSRTSVVFNLMDFRPTPAPVFQQIALK